MLTINEASIADSLINWRGSDADLLISGYVCMYVVHAIKLLLLGYTPGPVADFHGDPVPYSQRDIT